MAEEESIMVTALRQAGLAYLLDSDEEVVDPMPQPVVDPMPQPVMQPVLAHQIRFAPQCPTVSSSQVRIGLSQLAPRCPTVSSNQVGVILSQLTPRGLTVSSNQVGVNVPQLTPRGLTVSSNQIGVNVPQFTPRGLTVSSNQVGVNVPQLTPRCPAVSSNQIGLNVPQFTPRGLTVSSNQVGVNVAQLTPRGLTVSSNQVLMNGPQVSTATNRLPFTTRLTLSSSPVVATVPQVSTKTNIQFTPRPTLSSSQVPTTVLPVSTKTNQLPTIQHCSALSSSQVLTNAPQLPLVIRKVGSADSPLVKQQASMAISFSNIIPTNRPVVALQNSPMNIPLNPVTPSVVNRFQFLRSTNFTAARPSVSQPGSSTPLRLKVVGQNSTNSLPGVINHLPANNISSKQISGNSITLSNLTTDSQPVSQYFLSQSSIAALPNTSVVPNKTLSKKVIIQNSLINQPSVRTHLNHSRFSSTEYLSARVPLGVEGPTPVQIISAGSQIYRTSISPANVTMNASQSNVNNIAEKIPESKVMLQVPLENVSIKKEDIEISKNVIEPPKNDVKEPQSSMSFSFDLETLGDVEPDSVLGALKEMIASNAEVEENIKREQAKEAEKINNMRFKLVTGNDYKEPLVENKNDLTDNSSFLEAPAALPQVVQPAVLFPPVPPPKSNYKFVRNPNEKSLLWSNTVTEANVQEEEAEEELGYADAFSHFESSSKMKKGCKHPDIVVESASLSSVESPDIIYKLKMPKECIEKGLLSSVQLESITYACQKHETYLPSGERAGFLIGDGAGVGKGRTIAGIIYENYLQGRKRALWVSVSTDLKLDAERDLNDIGASNITVYNLGKFSYGKITSRQNEKVKEGVIFSTYSSLISESKKSSTNVKYSSRLKQLLHWLRKDDQCVIIFDECHKAKNGASTTSSNTTKTAASVLYLQQQLKNARVVYASATGASEPKNMGYMVRLGLWGQSTPFKDFSDFERSVDRRGVGAMEMIAMELKQRGNYIARQLSFKDVTFRVEEVELTKEFIKIYNKSVAWWLEARKALLKYYEANSCPNEKQRKVWGQFWSGHQRFFKCLCISSKIDHCVRLANKAILLGKSVVIGLQSTGESRMAELMEQKKNDRSEDDEYFMSAAKEVMKKIVEDCFQDGQGGLKNPSSSSNFERLNGKRKCDESSQQLCKKLKTSYDKDDENDNDDSDSEGSSPSTSDEDDSDDDDDDYGELDRNPFLFEDSSDEDELYLSKKRKQPSKKKEKKEKKKQKLTAKKSTDRSESSESCDNYDLKDSKFDNFSKLDCDSSELFVIKQKLLEEVEKFSEFLPSNALDDLIDKLGGPDRVAELTGRKMRHITTADGSVIYVKRKDSQTAADYINIMEKEKFMNGEKFIAVISDAASSGISLHADRRAQNQRQRLHITLELPWSADKAIQQFGRTHRSNQTHPPEYMFLISKLSGEQRFASTVAKRLESLGALTHGDRRAAGARDLSQFNIDNKYGIMALEKVMKSIIGVEKPTVIDKSYNDKFFSDIRKSLVGVGLLNESGSGFSYEKDAVNINKFLNRILGMEVDLQNALFEYFSATLREVILDAKKSKKLDLGILDIGSSGEIVTEIEQRGFPCIVSEVKTMIVLKTVQVDRGMMFKFVKAIYDSQSSGPEDGFYESIELRKGVLPLYQLAISTKSEKGESWFRIYKPNVGLQPNVISSKELNKTFKRVSSINYILEENWNRQYQSTERACLHSYQRKSCARKMLCEVGKRVKVYDILTGSVLSIWPSIENHLSSKDSRMQVIRVRMSDNMRVVGLLVDSRNKGSLITFLETLGNRHTPGLNCVTSSSSSHFS